MSLRLFIAVNFSLETRKMLLAFRDGLRFRTERGRFTAPENLHLTLVFLGNCDAGQTNAAKRSMNALRFEPFTITINGGGYLDRGRANLVFCELQNDSGRNQLSQLHAALALSLSAKGFKLERRKFWPHLTIGREVVWKEFDDSAAAGGIDFPRLEEAVTSLELMKSERINGKLTYTAIHSVKAEQ